MLLKRSLLVALSLGLTLVFAAQVAEAGLLRRTEAQLASLSKKTGGCAKPVDCAKAPECAKPEPSCSKAEPCCEEPCITYRHHGPKLCCDSCKPPKQIVLKVKNPCTGCETDVPVCIPACCEGEPKVCTGTGFLGRDVVEYEWCCGFSVKVAFKHCGDLLVSTWGR